LARKTIWVGGHEFDPLDEFPAARAQVPDMAGRVIVQLHDAVLPAIRQRLRDDHALRLDEYVPGGAFVEDLDSEQIRRVRDDPAVRAVAPFGPRLKLPPSEPSGLDRRVVLFGDGDVDAVARAIEAIVHGPVDVHDDRAVGGAAQVLCTLGDPSDAERIAALNGVRWIEPVSPIIHDDAATTALLQSGRVGAVPVWEHGLHGEQQVIGVIDGFLDGGHCWFRDAEGTPPGAGHRKLVAIRSLLPVHPDRHGTFVCGIAAGDDVGAPGSDADRGIAWAARISFGSSADVPHRISLLKSLLEDAAGGACIHTNSWHEEPHAVAQYNQTAADVDAFVWENEDHLVLGSSGNTGEVLGPPGTAKNALCVSACGAGPDGPHFGDGTVGPTRDARPRQKPEILAPGCGVTSAREGATCLKITMDGCASSWATPAAAAGAALVRQYCMEGWHPTGARVADDAFVPSGALLRALLINAALGAVGGEVIPSAVTGWGALQLDRVLRFGDAGHGIAIVDVRHHDGLLTGAVADHEAVVPDGAQVLTVTLAWSDPPAPAGSADPVVNDLDLVVTSPSGDRAFRGNVFAGGASVAGGQADSVNTVESVLVETPEAGVWSVTVVAAAVAVGKPGQGYALVIRVD
jgi:hypothetical protein